MRRHELSDEEWAIIEPLLPNKPRGVPRVDDRRVINGILWRFRTGAPWRDVPERYGPRTTLYNRFVRWRAAGVWDRLLAAVLQELRAVRGRNERLLNNVNLAWLQLRESEQPRAVICDSQQFIINRRHPTVQRVLRSSPIDPQSVRFFASAVYTALSTRLAGSYLADAAHFHRHLAARALAETAETQQRGPGRLAPSKVSMNPA